MPILKNKKQYRTGSKKFKDKLEQSMNLVGDVSGIVINLGEKFSPVRDIKAHMETNKVYLVTGHQRSELSNLDPTDIIIEERLETPNSVGTLARGYIDTPNGKFNVRMVCWDEDKEEFALAASNLLHGDTDPTRLFENISTDILKEAASNFSELKRAAERAVIDYEEPDYDNLNKDTRHEDEEPDYDDYQEDYEAVSSFKVVLEFTEDDYYRVIDKFNELKGTKEQIVFSLLQLD